MLKSDIVHVCSCRLLRDGAVEVWEFFGTELLNFTKMAKKIFKISEANLSRKLPHLITISNYTSHAMKPHSGITYPRTLSLPYRLRCAKPRLACEGP